MRHIIMSDSDMLHTYRLIPVWRLRVLTSNNTWGKLPWFIPYKHFLGGEQNLARIYSVCASDFVKYQKMGFILLVLQGVYRKFYKKWNFCPSLYLRTVNMMKTFPTIPTMDTKLYSTKKVVWTSWMNIKACVLQSLKIQSWYSSALSSVATLSGGGGRSLGERAQASLEICVS